MEELDLKSLFELIWKKKLLIISFVIIGAILGFTFNKYYTTPKYKSTVTFLLAQTGSAADSSITASDVTLNSKLVENYSELIKSDSIISEALNQLNIQMDIANLQKNITVESKKVLNLFNFLLQQSKKI